MGKYIDICKDIALVLYSIVVVPNTYLVLIFCIIK